MVTDFWISNPKPSFKLGETDLFLANKRPSLFVIVTTLKKVLLEFFDVLEYPLKSSEYREKLERHGLQNKFEKN